MKTIDTEALHAHLTGPVAKRNGELVAQRRDSIGLTQRQLADAVGVTGTAISNIECGVTVPRATLQHAIAHVLITEVSALWPQPSRLELAEMFGGLAA